MFCNFFRFDISVFRFQHFRVQIERKKEKERVDYFLLRTALDLRATCSWTSTSGSDLMSTCCSGSALTRLAAKVDAISKPSCTNASGGLEVVVDVDVDDDDDENDDGDDDDATGETGCTTCGAAMSAGSAFGTSTSTTCTLDCAECCKRREHEFKLELEFENTNLFRRRQLAAAHKYNFHSDELWTALLDGLEDVGTFRELSDQDSSLLLEKRKV